MDILNVLVLILPIILSGLGIYLTIKTPLAEHKIFWKVGLIFFGISLIALTIVQQRRTEAQKSRTAAQNEKRQNELLESSRKTELSNQYLRGQLYIVSKVLGQISAQTNNISGQTNNNGKQIITALGELARTSAEAQDTRSALERMNNKELYTKILDFDKGLIEWSIRMDQASREIRDKEGEEMLKAKNDKDRNAIWYNYVLRDVQQFNNYHAEFLQNFAGQATAFRDELIRRLGPQQDKTLPGPSVPLVFTGWITPQSVDATIIYLETLARKLPQKKTLDSRLRGNDGV